MEVATCTTDWVQITNLICNAVTVMALAVIGGRQAAVKARLDAREENRGGS